MNQPAIRQPSANQRWPMTGEAWLTLVDELGQLRIDMAALVVLHRGEHGLRLLVDGGLDAAARHGADDLPALVHGERRTGLSRRRALRPDDERPGGAEPLRVPAPQRLEDLSHS